MITTILINNYRKRCGLIFVLLLPFLHHSYAQNESVTEKIRVSPYAAMGGTVSQYIDQIQFVTFESGPRSAFGNIDQLEITDKYYIILDNDTQSILIFNKQGQFHAKIDGKKINPQQPIFFSFKFDRSSELIKINFLSGEFIFDLNGKLVLHNKKKPEQYLGVEISLGDKFSGYYFYVPQLSTLKKDSNAYELTIQREGRQIKKYLPYRLNVKYDDSQGSQSHMDFWAAPFSADSTVYYTRDYDYNIYKLTPYTFHAAYQFIFPLQLSLPPNFREDTLFNGKRQKFIKLNSQIIFKVGNFFKSGDNLLFRALTNNFPNLSYIYNNRSKSLICINKIVSDSGSYFLPVTDAEVGGADFINRGIIQFDGDYFYSSYSSLVLFHQMEANKDKHPQYPPLLLKYFSNKKNIKGNPVLVQLKFKPQL
jgi:hypothetical protein